MSLWNFNSTSSLFGSSSTSTNLYSLFSERSMIKSGTYKRLLRSYFSSTDSDSSSGTTSTKRSRGSSDIINTLINQKKNPTISEDSEKANSKLTAGLSSLKSSVSALQNESTYQDTENGSTAADKVVSAMKSYVSNYNDVVTASKTSTLSNKTAYVANMMSYTSKFADQLSEIGVTRKSDGTLQLDETKLKNADLSKVQKLFSSENVQSYGSLIASRAQFAGSSSGTSSTSSTNTGTTTSTKGTSAAALKKDGETLASDELYAKVKDKDGNETDAYDVDKILSTAKSFVNNYNNMFDAAESSTNSGVLANLSYIRERTKNNTSTLEQFGFSVDKNGRMKLDEDTFKKADMSEVKDFFKNYGAYVASNASRVSYYMNTNANATNGYTSNASYNIPATSSYDATN